MEIWEPPSLITGSNPVMVVSIKPINGVSPESGIATHSPLSSSHAFSLGQTILKY